MAGSSSESSDILCPPSFMMNKLYKNLCNNLSKSVLKKLKDASTLKSNIANPHNRQVQVLNVSRLIFTGVYGKLFLPEERTVAANSKSSPLFNIQTLERLYSVFGSEYLVKFHHGGDVCLISSWLVLVSPVDVINNNGEVSIIHPGRLLLPLKDQGDVITVFIPCGGPDPETDQIPSWCKEYTINDLINVKPEQLHYKQGDGVLSAVANQNYTIIKKDQVNEGDFILIRGQYLKVYAVSTDFNSDARNVVRFTCDMKGNVNKQKFSIASFPKLHGMIMDIPKVDVKEDKFVSVVLNKIDDDDIGILNVSFRNACFNSLGFLTHDTAIHI